MVRFAVIPTFVSAIFLTTLTMAAASCTDLDATSVEVAPGAQVATTVRRWDGVPFTDAEARAVLSYANHASLPELDDVAELDVRAARSIVQSRPVKSMRHLSNLFFVGADALKRLKVAAPVVEAVMAASSV